MNSKHPLLVGITGGIGAGKSIVTRVFSILGVPIYDADTRAKLLMTQDEALIAQIKNLFGAEAYLEDGSLNRPWIAQNTFNSPEKTAALNALVHPAVARDTVSWVSQNQEAPYLMKEAALLYESGSYKALDTIILVQAPKNLRIQRVLKRDPHRTEADVKAIISRQWPEEQKKAMATYHIVNDDQHPVLQQVLDLDRQLCRIALEKD